MEEIYFILLKTPMLISCMLIGIVCSILALIIYNRLPEKLKNEKMRIIAIVGFVSLCMSVSMTNYPELLKAKIAHNLAADSQDNPFYSAVFEHHTNAKATTVDILKDLAEQAPSFEDLQIAADDRIAHISHDYLFGDMVIATDEAVFEYMTHSLLIMETLKDKPATCKSYNEGEYDLVVSALPAAMHKKETQIKADIIKMAATQPYPLDKVYDIHGYYERLKAIYEDAGYDENDLLELENISNLPPEKACEHNIRFMSLLTALGQTQGPIMFKNLMLTSN